MFASLFGTPSTPPIFLKFRSSKSFIITTVATAVFTDVFVYGIVVPVLPFALTARVAINPDAIQTWIAIFLAVYGAALLIASPICGWLADHSSSRRMPLLLGLLALGVSTAMLCAGNSIAILAVGRILQGFSAAVVWTVGLALIVDTVGPQGVGQAMGYVGLSMSLAILAAPLLGGVVFATAGYYAVFAMAFGLIALDILMRLFLIEKKIAVQWLPVEEVAPQNETSTPTGTRESKADFESQNSPQQKIEADSITTNTAEETSPPATPPAAKTFAQRLPPVIYLVSSRRILASLWACVMQASLLTAFDSILPLFVAKTFHWNSTGAGLIFLPIVIGTFLGPVVGWLSDKYGARWFATAGFLLGCPFLILLRLVHENTIEQKVVLCALLTLIGLTFTLILTPEMAEITYAVEAKTKRHPPGFFGKNGAYAQAYSLFNMAWAAGCLVGPLLAGLVNQNAGWAITTLILGILSALTAIPTAIWTGGSIWKARRAKREGRVDGIASGLV